MKLPINKIICGAAEDVLKTLPDESVNCCISSPPYWALRDYGVEGQLGLEPTFEEYIDKIATPRLTAVETGVPVPEQQAGQKGLFEEVR